MRESSVITSTDTPLTPHVHIESFGIGVIPAHAESSIQA
jgi:hypothetical protein